MAGKVLSMEIGQGMTRVVEVDYQAKSPKIYNAFSLETPKDMVQDGVITRNEDFIINLKAELRKRNIRTESIVFTVASSRIANREARIPLCKPKQILPLITANAADYFPVDMNQYHLVYNILGKTEEEGVKQYRLSLLAVPNDVTTSYIDLARTLGMHIRAMDYVGNSIFQVVRHEMTSGVNAVIKIDEHSSLITIIKNGEIVLQRSVPHGVNGAIENVTELDVYGENLSYADATVVFTQQRCLRRYLNVDVDYQEAEDTSDEVMMSRIMITENLRYFIGNVGRILEYFVSRNDNTPIDNIYLVGIGADFVGMDELLSNELGYKVQKYTGLDAIRTGSPNFNALESMRVYAAAIGASYAPLQLLSPELLKGEKETSLVLPVAIFLAAVATAIVLFIVGSVGVSTAKSKNEEVKDKLERNKYLEEVNETYMKANETYSNIDVALNMGVNNNRLLTQFIAEMEQKMPEGFLTLLLQASEEEGITIDVVTASKKDAATVFQQLRTFETIDIIESSGFSEVYGLRPEYDALLEQIMALEIAEMEMELLSMADSRGMIPDDYGDLVKVEDLIDQRKQEMLDEKKDAQISLGRIIKELNKDIEEDDDKLTMDDVDPADFFVINVKFSVTCTYNPNCVSNEDYMSGVGKALEQEEIQRAKDEAEKERLEREEAAKKENADEDKNN
ncbi:MAG: pilus assembly protein PilM [Lachnospiraceae bacterium]|nr:pilus assembly protein PilM [Lachnospiraceae bacterium]